ncbi:N-acetyl-gamma-glutamyl-phosphate reductase [Sphingorhabdus sp. 109]|jgi:N-acetyl-gamma-glutamyl-phosphate reductase|uniref:N-acetyl-gamma-glutamyl-phosphate reductase n=1 Tax=Sphingorhabdus sp. 109 TaxID=2653173 RepID=UPI0012F1D537|nr:N-acetyl-gamma-glutamyl-phosphate reductase [Sphingorhabdus sp. 109]VWX59602.1 N-acetyl-gamma-glutamyl-phosphate reductase [Sphingorhabdus sp. 109]
MTQTVFIDGAVGTTGLEIADRLAGREEFAMVRLPDEQRKDPAARREAINDSDFVILCLPDDAAREAVALVDNDRTRFIDASTAHRVADGWVYGFAEFREGQRAAIADARFVSNPGCYPTGFLALVAPLIARGLLPADWSYVMNAVSGYSGGGKALIERFAQEPDLGFRSYGLNLDHKHMPEMKIHGGLTHDVIFAPSVIRAFRGMLVDVPLHLGAMGSVRAEQLLAELTAFYAGSTIVSVEGRGDLSELLISEDDPPTDRLELFVCGNAEGYHARLIARLDNLGKGASGAAVQNLNIMAGLDETAGLRL